MPKQRLTSMAVEYDVPFQEAIEIVNQKIPKEFVTGSGRNTWISEEGQAIIKDGLFIDEIIPKNFMGQVLKECPNPRYNFVYSKEIGKRVPVMVPRQLRSKLVGKVICFEGIQDEKGTSYRYIKR